MKVLIYTPKLNVANPEEEDYLYKLASLIQHYLTLKGTEVVLGRYSAEAPEISVDIILKLEEPDIFMYIQEGLEGGGPYIVSCSQYSSLVGSINLVLKDLLGNPIGSGLNVTTQVLYGKFADIGIDVNSLPDTSVENLDRFARRFTESTWWYPIRNKDVVDTPNIIDPYMYRFSADDTWRQELYPLVPETQVQGFKLGQNYNGCYGEFKVETDSQNRVIKYLQISTSFNSSLIHYQHELADEKSEIDPETGEEILIPIYDDDPYYPGHITLPMQHYTWKINSDIPLQIGYTLMFMCRGTGTGYIKLGKEGAQFYMPHSLNEYPLHRDTSYKDYTTPLSSDWTLVSIPIELAGNNCIEIGMIGNGHIDITGIYLTNATDKYSMYPNGYRLELPEQTQGTIPTAPIPVLTRFEDFDNKAKEIIETPPPVPPEPEPEPIPSPSDNTSLASMEGFKNVVIPIITQLTTDELGLKIPVDINSLMTLDTDSMIGLAESYSSYETKNKIMSAKDKLDALQAGASNSASEIVAMAKDMVIGQAMAAITGQGGAKIDFTKIPVPSPEALKNLDKVNCDFKATSEALQSQLLSMAGNLKLPPDMTKVMAKADKMQSIVSKAQEAVAIAKQTATLGKNGLAGISGVVNGINQGESIINETKETFK